MMFANCLILLLSLAAFVMSLPTWERTDMAFNPEASMCYLANFFSVILNLTYHGKSRKYSCGVTGFVVLLFLFNLNYFLYSVRSTAVPCATDPVFLRNNWPVLAVFFLATLGLISNILFFFQAGFGKIDDESSRRPALVAGEALKALKKRYGGILQSYTRIELMNHGLLTAVWTVSFFWGFSLLAKPYTPGIMKMILIDLFSLLALLFYHGSNTPTRRFTYINVLIASILILVNCYFVQNQFLSTAFFFYYPIVFNLPGVLPDISGVMPILISSIGVYYCFLYFFELVNRSKVEIVHRDPGSV